MALKVSSYVQPRFDIVAARDLSVRQTVLNSVVSGGAPSYLVLFDNSSGWNDAVRISASPTDPFIYTVADGFSAYGNNDVICSVEENVDCITLVAAATNILYVVRDQFGDTTLQNTVLVPSYSASAPSSPADGQLWFDLVRFKPYRWNDAEANWDSVLWCQVGTVDVAVSGLATNAVTSVLRDSASSSPNALYHNGVKIAETSENGLKILVGSSSDCAASRSHVASELAALVDSAPGTLDTLNELAAALADDPDFATTMTNALAGKLSLSGGMMGGAIDLDGNNITNGGSIYGTFSGNITGNVTGNCSGSSGSCTGNAATATAAKYADLAEKYICGEGVVGEGTVLCVSKNTEDEVEICEDDCCPSVIGILSAKPGFTLNIDQPGGVVIGLVGKLPVRIIGEIQKGDSIVSAGSGGCARKCEPEELVYKIGVALESNSNPGEKLVLCAVK